VEKKFIVQDGQIVAAISQSNGGNTLPGAGANGLGRKTTTATGKFTGCLSGDGLRVSPQVSES
jgi:hypothetical protein